jgi:hypothetical protein
MAEQEDAGFTFSEADFDRRYSTDEDAPSASATGHPSHSPNPRAQPPAAPIGRSRNRFMRTLLRRRMSSSAS